MLHPENEINPKVGATFDILLLIIFGAWTFIPAWFWLFGKSNPNLADACGGPGWADFGCTGDTDTMWLTIVNVIVWLITLSITLLVVARLINRARN